MKDWSILLIKNTKGTVFQRLFWWLIRVFTNSNYNHAQLIRDFNGKLYICESDLTGFRITKTLDKWKAEQVTMQREYAVIDLPFHSERRFNHLLGNKYDAGYWIYLTKMYSSIDSTNCFQSLAYIFTLNNHWLATANTFIKSYKKYIQLKR